MPFKSQAQKGFLFAKHPGIAKKFEAETPKGRKLPPHKDGKGPLAQLFEKKGQIGHGRIIENRPRKHEHAGG